MINSRKLDDLLPCVQKMAKDFVSKCAAVGIDVLITSTYRDMEEQARLFAQGRTTPGNIVTNARPGESFHNYRCAFDFVPRVNGIPQWEDLSLFRKCGEIAEICGLEWAGRWVKMKEMAHCQFSGGLTIADLKSGKKVPDCN
jgi:peptidoglycan L-alanyl-D-glutamate endopeptidase CwlK